MIFNNHNRYFSKLSYEEQLITLEHELEHIRNEDFEAGANVALLEQK